MQKYILILLFLGFSLVASAKSFDFTGLNYSSESIVNSKFDEFGKVFGSAMNSGTGNLMNFDFVKISLGAMVMPYKKTGVMANSSQDYLMSQSTVLGISLFDFNLYGRFIALPEDGKMIAGGGLGYQIKIMPLLTVTPSITYHQGLNFLEIPTLTAYAFHVQARGNFEAVQPFVSLGASYNIYNTNIVLDDGTYFNYANLLIHGSLGVRILYLYYELTFMPRSGHAFGITIDF